MVLRIRGLEFSTAAAALRRDRGKPERTKRCAVVCSNQCDERGRLTARSYNRVNRENRDLRSSQISEGEKA